MELDYMSELKKALKKTKLEVDVTKLDPDKDLTEQGVDSMDNINILFAIEDYFRVTVPDEILLTGKLNTLNNIFKFIAESR